LEQVFKDTGLIDEWKAEGRAEGREEGALGIAQNMVKLGLPIETVISATQLEPEKIIPLYQQ